MTDVMRIGRLAVPLSELTWRFDTPGGPGGQHANRAATRAEVRFDVAASPSLSDSQRARLLARLGPVVIASSAETRSQSRNRSLALDALRRMLGDALIDAPRRRPTRPSRGSKERRLAAKRRRSETKAQRRRPPPAD